MPDMSVSVTGRHSMIGAMLDRRSFLAAAAGAGAASSLTSCSQLPSERGSAPTAQGVKPIAVATWPFGQKGTERSIAVLRDGGAAIDAVEQGIREVEVMGNLKHPNLMPIASQTVRQRQAQKTSPPSN